MKEWLLDEASRWRKHLKPLKNSYFKVQCYQHTNNEAKILLVYTFYILKNRYDSLIKNSELQYQSLIYYAFSGLQI